MNARHAPLRIGVGGPVGSGKTALLEVVCKAMRDDYNIAVVTNDIYTQEDAMILTRDVIRREIEMGRVVIEPFFAGQVGPASIDLHLGDEIRVMHAGQEPVPVTDDVDYRTITDVRSIARFGSHGSREAALGTA